MSPIEAAKAIVRQWANGLMPRALLTAGCREGLELWCRQQLTIHRGPIGLPRDWQPDWQPR